MGGKRKPAQRTKNNVRPSSSGRSAELLNNSPTMFLGYSALKDSGILPPVIPGLSPFSTSDFDSNVTPEFQLIMKKMNKRDAVTKHKALQEFSKLCEESNVEDVKAVLPYWPRLYSMLALDICHRVRDVCQEAHRVIVNKVGRNIAPYLKQVIGPWFISPFDTFPLAGQKAALSFEEAFPPNKRIEAVLFCHSEILDYIVENLINHTPSTLSNPNCTPADEMSAKYERVVVASFHGYSQLIEKLPADTLKNEQEKHKQKLISLSAFWKYAKHENPQIRKAWFEVIISVCRKAPYLLSENVKKVCTTVFVSLDDKDPAVTPVVWEAALHIIISFNDCWEHVSLNKVLLPKLWNTLREGGYGNAVHIYPKLLPLLSKIPAPEDDAWYHTFFNKFFENMKFGFYHRNVQQSSTESKAVINAFFECSRYVFMLHSKNTNLCQSLLKEQIFDLMDSALNNESLKTNSNPIFSNFSVLLKYWHKYQDVKELHLTYSSVVHSSWELLVSICRKPFQEQVLEEWKLSNQLNLIKALKESSIIETKKNLKVRFSSPANSDKNEDDEELEKNYVTSDLNESFNEKFEKFIFTLMQEYYSSLEKSFNNISIVKNHICKIIILCNSEAALNHLLLCSSKNSDGNLDNNLKNLWDSVIINWLSDDKTQFELVAHLLFILLNYLDENYVAEILDDFISKFSSRKFIYILHWCLFVDTNQDSTKTLSLWFKHEKLQDFLVLLAENLTLDSEDSDKKCAILSKFLSSKENDIFYSSNSTISKIIKSFKHTFYQLVENSGAESLSIKNIDLLISLISVIFENKNILSLNDEIFNLTKETTLIIFKLCCLQSHQTVLNIHDSIMSCWRIGLNSILAQHKCVDSPEIITYSEEIIECILKVLASSDLKHTQALVQLSKYFIIITVKSFSENQLPYKDESSIAHLCNLFLRNVMNYCEKNLEEKITKLCVYSEIVNGNIYPCINYDKLNDDINKINGNSEEIGPNEPDVSLKTHQFDFINCEDFNYFVNINVFSLSLILSFVDVPTVFNLISNEKENQPVSAEKSDDEEVTLTNCFDRMKDYIVYLFRTLEVLKSFKSNFTNTLPSFSLSEDVILFLSLNLQSIVRGFNAEHIQSFFSIIHPPKSEEFCLFNHLRFFSIINDINELKSINWFINEEKDKLSKLTEISNLDVKILQNVNTYYNHQISEMVNLDKKLVMSHQMDLIIKNKSQIIGTYSKNLLDVAPSDLLLASNVCRFLIKFLNEKIALTEDDKDNVNILSDVESEFILIALTAWVQSLSKTVEMLDVEPSFHINISIFLSSVCDFLETFSNFVKCLNEETGISSEWRDVFMIDVHNLLANSLKCLVKNSSRLSKSVQVYLIVRKLSNVVINTVDFNLIVKNDDDLQKWSSFAVQTSVDSNIFVQLSAFHILMKLVPKFVEFDTKTVAAEMEGEMDEIDAQDTKIVFNWFKPSLDQTQSIISTMLSDFKLGDSCLVAPLTDSYSYTLAYLNLWSVIFEMVSQADSQLRYRYFLWVKNENLISKLIPNLIHLLPESVIHGEFHEGSVKRLRDLFAQKPLISTNEQWNSDKLSHLACWTYSNSLRRLPALIRQWWMEVEHKEARMVEDLTTRYVSPLLCDEELKALREAKKPTENFTIRVLPSVREVVATYSLDEIFLEVSITMAENHPLGMVRVESSKTAMSPHQWHHWLKQCTVFLTHQNGSIWDGLMSWKSNIDKRFEGVEECYICFSILHHTNYELPRKNCRTCHKKFHLDCLYKWFTTSNKPTCPICRNLF